MTDMRNVIDEFKGMSEEDIISVLDQRAVKLEIAIENLERDFNMGSIVRTANAFGVRNVHIIGRKQWNKRGAMATDRYMHVHYHESVQSFVSYVEDSRRVLVAVDNVPGAESIANAPLPADAVLLFGSEANGISEQLLASAYIIVAIRQLGSTRSLNVGAAAAIAMYEWQRKNT